MFLCSVNIYKRLLYLNHLPEIVQATFSSSNEPTSSVYLYDKKSEINPLTGKSVHPDLPTKPLEIPKNLDWEKAKPFYAARIPVRHGYALVKGKGGEMMANENLFEAAIDKAQISETRLYDILTEEERSIYMAHIKAVKEHKLWYNDPKTGSQVATVSQLLFNECCCGNNCRHCPYEHSGVPEADRQKLTWNGAFYM